MNVLWRVPCISERRGRSDLCIQPRGPLVRGPLNSSSTVYRYGMAWHQLHGTRICERRGVLGIIMHRNVSDEMKDKSHEIKRKTTTTVMSKKEICSTSRRRRQPSSLPLTKVVLRRAVFCRYVQRAPLTPSTFSRGFRCAPPSAVLLSVGRTVDAVRGRCAARSTSDRGTHRCQTLFFRQRHTMVHANDKEKRLGNAEQGARPQSLVGLRCAFRLETLVCSSTMKQNRILTPVRTQEQHLKTRDTPSESRTSTSPTPSRAAAFAPETSSPAPRSGSRKQHPGTRRYCSPPPLLPPRRQQHPPSPP